MTSKEKVLAAEPSACHWGNTEGLYVIGFKDGDRFVQLGQLQETIEAAWQNASESLPVAPKQEVVYDAWGKAGRLQPVAPVEADEEIEYPCCGRCLKPVIWTGNRHKHKYPGECMDIYPKPKPVAEPKPTTSTSSEMHKNGWHYGYITCSCGWAWDSRNTLTGSLATQHGLRMFEKHKAEVSKPPEIELELRRMMWLGHGHAGMYGDDGEMQCMECRSFGVVDYKREPLDKVRETFRAVQMKRMMKPRDSSSISAEHTFEEGSHKAAIELLSFLDIRFRRGQKYANSLEQTIAICIEQNMKAAAKGQSDGR